MVTIIAGVMRVFPAGVVANTTFRPGAHQTTERVLTGTHGARGAPWSLDGGVEGDPVGTRGVLTGTRSMQPNEDVGLSSAVHCRPRRLQQWYVPRPDFINGLAPIRVPTEYPRVPSVRRLQQWCVLRPDFRNGLTPIRVSTFRVPQSTPAVPRTELTGSPQPPATPGPVRALRCPRLSTRGLIGLPLRVCCVGTEPHICPESTLHVADGIILGYSRVP
jgi:hypothetical protein